MNKIVRAEVIAGAEILGGLLSVVSGLWWVLTPWRWDDRWQHKANVLDRMKTRVLLWQVRATIRRD